jgi:nicotinamidase-related amidase
VIAAMSTVFAAPDLRIDPARAALLVVDVQQRLAAAMPSEDLAAVERNVRILVEAARLLHIPVVASEQYPRGLGPTVPSVAQALDGPGLDVRRFEKLEFACPAAPAWEPIWSELRRDQWIVTGMETHVCVYQSVRDLVRRGATVHVPIDGVASRTRENRRIGLSLIERAGGVVSSTETVVFDALGRAGTEEFKALSKLVK